MDWVFIATVMIFLSLWIFYICQYSPHLYRIEAFGNTVSNLDKFISPTNSVIKIGNIINEVSDSINKNLSLRENGNSNVFNGSFIESDHNHLVVEKVIGGLSFPTSFIFLDNGDILFLEKNTGQIGKIANESKISQPLLHVNVASKGESGMLGIASSKMEKTGKTYVYLYFTEALIGTGGINFSYNYVSSNRLYKYELTDNALAKPELLLQVPTGPSGEHNGGKLIIGPDNNLYLITGDTVDTMRSASQNAVDQNGLITPFDGTSSILRISQEGKAIRGIISNDTIGQKIYAYGIRNGFGLDFDPVTGDLWDTENGPAYGDEINHIIPGFNSGWSKVQGVWKHTRDEIYPSNDSITFNPPGLLDFNGTGIYRSPEFTWRTTVGPTAIKFLNSNKLGKDYANDLFVGDVNNGNLYHFDLNSNRSGLLLNGSLVDKVANSVEELKSHIFLSAGGGITDIKVGPDGFLYFSTLGKSHIEEEAYPSSDGSIYRIRPEGK